MSDAIVLQSGFLAVPNGNYVLNPPTDEGIVLFKEAKYDKHLARHRFPQPYHAGIQELFTLYEGNELIINQFDFAEKLYQQIFDAFGELSFYQWVTLQAKEGDFHHMTNYHTSFVNALIDYMLSGQWGIEPEVWITMLYARSGHDLGKIKLDDLDTQGTSRPIISTVSEFIMDMSSHRTGLKNLLYVAAIIFGEKDVPRLTGN